MLQLKPLPVDSIPMALVKAKHYRLLNEPWQAESICRDVLNVDPDNQTAITYLILAITDQFTNDSTATAGQARSLCAKLTDKFEYNYYRGIIAERAGNTTLKRNIPRVNFMAFEYYNRAMNFYETAQSLKPNDNDDAVLRWNACVRRIKEFKLEAAPEDAGVQPFLDV